MIKLERYTKNPIIKPRENVWWEAKAVFNPAVIHNHSRIHLIYRAMGADRISRFGHAYSTDGYNFKGFNESCCGKVKVNYVPFRSERISVSRDLENETNPFFVHISELEEIMTDEERKEKILNEIKDKYNNKLEYLNTSPMIKDLKRYSEEDLRKIFNTIIKDLNKI